MAHTQGADAPQRTGFLTEADEMSLAESRLRQVDTSEPDTLEVRGDSMTLLQEEIEPWRRPAQLALAALGVGLVALIGAGVVMRRATPRG